MSAAPTASTRSSKTYRYLNLAASQGDGVNESVDLLRHCPALEHIRPEALRPIASHKEVQKCTFSKATTSFIRKALDMLTKPEATSFHPKPALDAPAKGTVHDPLQTTDNANLAVGKPGRNQPDEMELPTNDKSPPSPGRATTEPGEAGTDEMDWRHRHRRD
jgi:hypothetical protein